MFFVSSSAGTKEFSMKRSDIDTAQIRSVFRVTQKICYKIWRQKTGSNIWTNKVLTFDLICLQKGLMLAFQLDFIKKSTGLFVGLISRWHINPVNQTHYRYNGTNRRNWKCSCLSFKCNSFISELIASLITTRCKVSELVVWVGPSQ